jgi:hypothetical protein
LARILKEKKLPRINKIINPKQMKMQKLLITIFMIVSVFGLNAQNYKAPKIDASGTITNEKGNVIGSVTTGGVLSDSAGVKIAHVDSNGNFVDLKTGKVMGKAAKNGIILPYFEKTPDTGWSISSPLNGTCTVKDEKGKVVAEVHESYKKFGACAIHCLQHKTDHH